MDTPSQQINEFFDGYCDMYNEGIKKYLSDSDLERVAALYSDCFIAASPAGVSCGTNDEKLKKVMAQGYAFYRDIGIVRMDIVSKEITILDDFHAMTKLRFKASFKNKRGVAGNVEFDNIYFTQSKDSRHKVFGYITGDEQQALKEAGLLSIVLIS